MADQCLVPVSALVPLPTGVAVADGCLVEPLAVAVHAVRRAPQPLAVRNVTPVALAPRLRSRA